MAGTVDLSMSQDSALLPRSAPVGQVPLPSPDDGGTEAQGVSDLPKVPGQEAEQGRKPRPSSCTGGCVHDRQATAPAAPAAAVGTR